MNFILMPNIHFGDLVQMLLGELKFPLQKFFLFQDLKLWLGFNLIMSRIEVTFKVSADVEHGDYVAVVGDSPELGAWDVNRGLLLSTDESSHPWWSAPAVSLTLPDKSGKLHYKYIRLCGFEFEAWEEFVGNRTIEISEGATMNFTTSDYFNLRTSVFVKPTGIERNLNSPTKIKSSEGIITLLSQVDSLASLIVDLANSDESELEPLKEKLSRAPTSDFETQLNLMSEYLSYSLERSVSIRPDVEIIFEVSAETSFGEHIAVVGNVRELGNWDPKWSLPLRTSARNYPNWHSNPLKLKLMSVPFNLEFKYVKMYEERFIGFERFHGTREIRILGGTQFNIRTTDVIDQRSILIITAGEPKVVAKAETPKDNDQSSLVLISYVDQTAKLLRDANDSHSDDLDRLRAEVELGLSSPFGDLKIVLQEYLYYIAKESAHIAGHSEVFAKKRAKEITHILKNAELTSKDEIQVFREIVSSQLEGTKYVRKEFSDLEFNIDSALKALLLAPISVVPMSLSRCEGKDLLEGKVTDGPVLQKKVEAIECLAYSITEPEYNQELQTMLEKSRETSNLFLEYSIEEKLKLQDLENEYSQLVTLPSCSEHFSLLHKYIEFNNIKMKRFSNYSEKEIDEVCNELQKLKRKQELKSPSTAAEPEEGNIEGVVEAAEQTAQLLVGMTEARENELTHLRSVKLSSKEKLEMLVLLNLKLVGQLADCSDETDELFEEIVHRKQTRENMRPIRLKAHKLPLRPDYLNLDNEANLSLRHAIELTKTGPLTQVHQEAYELSRQGLSPSKPIEQICQKVAFIQKLKSKADSSNFENLLHLADQTFVYLAGHTGENELQQQLKLFEGEEALLKYLECNLLLAKKLAQPYTEKGETDITIMKRVDRSRMIKEAKPQDSIDEEISHKTFTPMVASVKQPSVRRGKNVDSMLDASSTNELSESLAKYAEQMLQIGKSLSKSAGSFENIMEQLEEMYGESPKDKKTSLEVLEAAMNACEKYAEIIANYSSQDAPSDFEFIIEAVRTLRHSVESSSPGIFKSIEALKKLTGMKGEDSLKSHATLSSQDSLESVPEDLSQCGEYVVQLGFVIKKLGTKLQKYHLERVADERLLQSEVATKLVALEEFLNDEHRRAIYEVLQENLKLSEPYQEDNLQELISKRNKRQSTLGEIVTFEQEVANKGPDDDVLKALKHVEGELYTLEELSQTTLSRLATFFDVEASASQQQTKHSFSLNELVRTFQTKIDELKALECKKVDLFASSNLQSSLESLWKEVDNACKADLKPTIQIASKLARLLGSNDDKQILRNIQECKVFEPSSLKELVGGVSTQLATYFSSRDKIRDLEERLTDRLKVLEGCCEELDENSGEVFSKSISEVNASSTGSEELKANVRQWKSKASEIDETDDGMAGKASKTIARLKLLLEIESTRKSIRAKQGKEIAAYKHQLSAKDEEIETLRSQSEGGDELGLQIEVLRKANEESKVTLAKALEESANKDTILNQQRVEQGELTQKLADYEINLLNANEEVNANHNQIKLLKKQLKEREVKLKEALAQLEDSTQTLVSQTSSQELSERITSLRSEVSKLMDDLQTQDLNLNNLKSEKAKLQRDYDQVLQELEDERKRHSEAKHELSKTKVGHLKSKLVVSSDILDQSAEIERLRAQVAALEAPRQLSHVSEVSLKIEPVEETKSQSSTLVTETVTEEFSDEEVQIVQKPKKKIRRNQKK